MRSVKRTDYCGTLTAADIGREVCVKGWAQKQRDLGSLIFIDLRDRAGIVQLAFDDETSREVFEKASAVRSEFVLSAVGIVRERSSKNLLILTGEVEISVTGLDILAVSQTPPFDIADNCNAGEDLRLRYRYLDLRRPALMKNLLFRNKLSKITRDFFYENGFVEIETPILVKSTPEGARDYLVPSRVHKGSFYALPQSPQLYKQLSMVAGFDRYYQLARCFRDEDLRADRQPEFTQIDVEMSFVDVEDVLDVGERYVTHVFSEMLGIDIELPIQRLTYRECMERFGTDKPDLRYGMELVNISDLAVTGEFGAFNAAVAAGGSVRAINVKGGADKLTRKELDRLAEYAKGIGAGGLAWARATQQGVTCPFAKYFTQENFDAICKRTELCEGDVLLVIADGDDKAVMTRLGAIRVEVANRIGVEKSGYRLLWVLEMPFFEYDSQLGEYVAMHHPFTAPLDECVDILDTDKANVRAKAYDLVLNGIELASGSIRITDPVLQSRIFTLLGLSEEEAQRKFGYLLDAFRYGAPPHGGMALGLDRLAMQLLGVDSLRDVVAYPKIQNASELMTSCPSDVPQDVLDDLGICVKEDRKTQ